MIRRQEEREIPAGQWVARLVPPVALPEETILVGAAEATKVDAFSFWQRFGGRRNERFLLGTGLRGLCRQLRFQKRQLLPELLHLLVKIRKRRRRSGLLSSPVRAHRSTNNTVRLFCRPNM
ncbi:MAG: hypothetical protein DMG93_14790 [Acidobacteria bacterium]|nr:MAG: hypothetical protein DMG93_14790 [Acidobacteriota bacterium]